MANPNPDISNLTPFKPGESGNPNGRPRKLVSKIISHLNDNGVENVTKEQVVGAIEVCLNLTKEELSSLSDDNTQPYLIQTIASHITDSKDSFHVLNFILERAFGKPNQKTDLNVNTLPKLEVEVVKPDESK